MWRTSDEVQNSDNGGLQFLRTVKDIPVYVFDCVVYEIVKYLPATYGFI